jgi:hypothetical protein
MQKESLDVTGAGEEIKTASPSSSFIINIDDDQATVECIDFYIRNHFQFSTLKFTSPKDVIEYCKSNPVSTRLIITNEVMPFLCGRELLKELDDIVQIPLFAILHSGYLGDKPGPVEEFYETKYKWIIPLKFFTKPFPIQELGNVLSNLFSDTTGKHIPEEKGR